MKKAVFLLTIVAATFLMSVPAFAHGGHGRGHSVRSQASYQTCTVERCTETGLHEHGGTWYACADYGTGTGCGGGYCRNA